MKIIYKFLISGCLILLTTLSCKEDFLEIRPFGSVSEETLLSENGINGVLIGAYRGLVGRSIYNASTYLYPGDDTRIGSGSGVNLYSVFTYNPADGYILTKWQYLFLGVARSNTVLGMLGKVEDINPNTKLQFEAEAKVLRAYYHFYLTQLFKHVPWIDETVEYTAKNYLVPNTEDIYPKIEADVKFAANNLTETKSEVGRVNKWAAKSLLAKVYMYQYKYTEALSLLNEIIANGKTSNGLKYGLQAEYNLNFIQRGKNSKEAIFVAEMSVNDGSSSNSNGNPEYSPNGPYGSPAASCCGWGAATFDLVEAYKTDPETGLPLLETYYETPVVNDNGIEGTAPFTPYQGTLDSRLDWTVGRRGIPYRDWGVFPGKPWVRNQSTSGPYVAIKNICEQATAARDKASGAMTNNPVNLIRFADVLLWAAECEIEVGSLQKAEEYVNTVRARAANPVSWVYKYIDDSKPLNGFSKEPAANYKVGLYNGQFAANGKSYARKAVRFERRLEFAYEGHRYVDMSRWDGHDFDMASEMNAFFKREAPKLSNAANLYFQGNFVKGKNECLPIPQREIDLSVKPDGKSVLVQNPGWD